MGSCRFGFPVVLVGIKGQEVVDAREKGTSGTLCVRVKITHGVGVDLISRFLGSQARAKEKDKDVDVVKITKRNKQERNWLV